MDKALLIIFSFSTSKFICCNFFLNKTSLLSPPLLLHHIFYVSTIHQCSNRTQDNNANVLWTGWWEYWRSGRCFRVEEVLKCGRGFTVKVNFPGGQNLFAQEWGGEIIVHNAAMNPKWTQTQAGPPPSLLLFHHIFYINLKHQLLSIFMLEHFFRQFLKNRSHDRSAHTFGSSHRFLEVPIREVKKKTKSIWMDLVQLTRNPPPPPPPPP